LDNATNLAHIPTGEQLRRERIGVSVSAPDVQALLRTIDEAEAAGIAQLWMTQNPTSLNSLSAFAAAFVRTQRVRLGTSIVPT
jgi:alkanesulfonate monooxygenase SsuD/methylene tetrahydromethanopterin reductase-like flavin-dependent oxidoreductase (luciferase family)